MNMLKQFQEMSDGQLRQISTATHGVDLSSPEARLIHAVPYITGSEAQEVEKHNIHKMLARKVFEPAQTECPSPILIILEEDETLGFWVDCNGLNAVTSRDLYRLPRMGECINFLEMKRNFSHLTQIAAIGKF